MAMKGFSRFPQALAVEPHHQMQFGVILRTLVREVLPLCSDVVGVFYRSSCKGGCWLVGWLVGFYGISTFVGYLMPNPFLYK